MFPKLIITNFFVFTEIELMDYYLGNWRSLVDEIEKDSRDEQHLTTAIQWYENEASSRYGCQPQWNELLTCLLHKEPVIKNGVLEL